MQIFAEVVGVIRDRDTGWMSNVPKQMIHTYIDTNGDQHHILHANKHMREAIIKESDIDLVQNIIKHLVRIVYNANKSQMEGKIEVAQRLRLWLKREISTVYHLPSSRTYEPRRVSCGYTEMTI